MSITEITRPAAYPITLSEAKAHLNIEHGDDDAIIGAMIASATDYAESYTNRDFIQRTWAYSFDSLSGGGFLLPKSPVQSVSSITYIDGDGASQTLSTDVYDLDSGVTPSLVYLKYNQSWPATRSQRNAITVTFISGYAGLGSPVDVRGGVPDVIRQAVKLLIGDNYANRENIIVGASLANTKASDSLLSAYRVYK